MTDDLYVFTVRELLPSLPNSSDGPWRAHRPYDLDDAATAVLDARAAAQSPADAQRVANAIVADLDRLEGAGTLSGRLSDAIRVAAFVRQMQFAAEACDYSTLWDVVIKGLHGTGTASVTFGHTGLRELAARARQGSDVASEVLCFWSSVVFTADRPSGYFGAVLDGVADQLIDTLILQPPWPGAAVAVSAALPWAMKYNRSADVGRLTLWALPAAKPGCTEPN